jgi:hypothetical protein
VCVVEFWDEAGKADNVAVLKIEEYVTVSICCFILSNYVTMHSAKDIKFLKKYLGLHVHEKYKKFKL